MKGDYRIKIELVSVNIRNRQTLLERETCTQ